MPGESNIKLTINWLPKNKKTHQNQKQEEKRRHKKEQKHAKQTGAAK